MMRTADVLAFARTAAGGTPLRTALMMLAMAIGVAAVVVLTALGDGARRYVVGEFDALGSKLVIVLPGRTATGGLSPGNLITNTPRDLTVADAQALLRAPSVRRVAPLAVGNAEISANGRLRDALVVGTGSDYLALRRMTLGAGRFLPAGDPRRGGAVAVIGATLQQELFGNVSAVGQTLRLGDRRLRVIGVLARSGQSLGMNADEQVIVPVATALALFDTNTLFRILVEARGRDTLPAVKAEVMRMLKSRHGGEEDVTLITQDAVLGTFDRILGALTLAVGGIAAISLCVAGILVMNVMLVAVSQRTGEIGLLKALGATPRQIRRLFLAEAALLSCAGALAGLLLGLLGTWGLRAAFPELPAWPPRWAVAAGLSMALGTGLLFGVLPARRAAALDPVQALSRR